MFGYGLGKSRTRLGRWLDHNGISQRWLESKTGLGEATIGRLCNDKEYEPQERTKMRIIVVLRCIDEDVSVSDFW